MPLREYVCESCGRTIEEITKTGNEPDSITCEACGSRAIRTISRFSFVLKGGGWYSTGYQKAPGDSAQKS